MWNLPGCSSSSENPANISLFFEDPGPNASRSYSTLNYDPLLSQLASSSPNWYEPVLLDLDWKTQNSEIQSQEKAQQDKVSESFPWDYSDEHLESSDGSESLTVKEVKALLDAPISNTARPTTEEIAQQMKSWLENQKMTIRYFATHILGRNRKYVGLWCPMTWDTIREQKANDYIRMYNWLRIDEDMRTEILEFVKANEGILMKVHYKEMKKVLMECLCENKQPSPAKRTLLAHGYGVPEAAVAESWERFFEDPGSNFPYSVSSRFHSTQDYDPFLTSLPSSDRNSYSDKPVFEDSDRENSLRAFEKAQDALLQDSPNSSSSNSEFLNPNEYPRMQKLFQMPPPLEDRQNPTGSYNVQSEPMAAEKINRQLARPLPAPGSASLTLEKVKTLLDAPITTRPTTEEIARHMKIWLMDRKVSVSHFSAHVLGRKGHVLGRRGYDGLRRPCTWDTIQAQKTEDYIRMLNWLRIDDDMKDKILEFVKSNRGILKRAHDRKEIKKTLVLCLKKNKKPSPEEQAEFAQKYGYSEDVVADFWKNYNGLPENLEESVADEPSSYS